MATLASFSCPGQQPANSKQNQSFADIPSVAGPAKVGIGELAEITLPEGYRFVEPSGARLILAAMKNPIPQNLLGLLRPEHGGWFALVEFADVGYVSDASPAMDGAAILKVVKENFAKQNKTFAGAPPVGDVQWALPPTYTPAENRLEYAILESNSGEDPGSVNHCVTLLGRRGVLTMVGVLPNQPNLDLAPFRELSRGIAFKSGQRYADHQAEDRLAHSSLAELIANDNDLMSFARVAMNQIETKGPWAAAALALLFAGWRLTAVAMKTRKPALPARTAARRVVRRPLPNGSPLPAIASVPALSSHPRNGKSLRRLGQRKKKRFSYHAFYSDMVMSLTRCNYVGGFGTFTAEQPEDINGSVFPEGPLPPIQSYSHAPAARPSRELAQESAKLIDSQQKLIEGQRQLIEEQSKLIQEKSRLIDAENRVLEKQTELFADHELQ